MKEILLVIAPLFLIILLGAFLERLKIADERWSHVLNEFALKIGFPALIFAALTGTRFNLSLQLDLIAANSAFLIGSFLLAGLIAKILKLDTKNLRTLFITLGFGNVAYLGIPTLVQIRGEAILPVASLIVAVYLFWMFTIGIGFLEYWQSGKKHVTKNILGHLIKNPLLVAVIIGLLVAGLQIPIPGILNQSINMIAASVTPIVLIVIGLFIGRSEFGSIKKWLPSLAFSMISLMLLPAFFYYGVILAGEPAREFSTSIIQAAMPLAITPFALADMYKLNKKFIARSIVMSTILSIITIPFWTSLV